MRQSIRQRKGCVICNKTLLTKNKSGLCHYHLILKSSSGIKTRKKYAESRRKKRVVAYTKAFSILRERHPKEFKEIFNSLKCVLDKQEIKNG